MRVTVLGGCGAWPSAGQACSGYLVSSGGFRLLVDPGYAALPRLLSLIPAGGVSAVLVSHGHPDHCSDLNPLLRARALGSVSLPPLRVYAPSGALDAVLALDSARMLRGSYALTDLGGGDAVRVGPFHVEAWWLPHHVPNLGFRVSVPGGGAVMAYTGDTGPSRDVAELADGAGLLVAEATYVAEVPAEDAAFLSSARQAGEYAAAARVERLMLTHLWPGTDPAESVQAAREAYAGPITVARPGLVVEVGS